MACLYCENRDPWITTRNASRLLGVTANTVRAWVDAGKMSADRLPSGYRRLHQGEVERVWRVMNEHDNA